LKFAKITLADKKAAEECIASSGTFCCDASFVNLYIWRDVYPSEVCFENGFLFRRRKAHAGYVHSFPLGKGDASAALKKLRGSFNGHLRFDGLTGEQCAELIKCFPDTAFEFEEQRQLADYIYITSDLTELAGKKYHAKKNFVNRFKSAYAGRYEVEDISAANAGELRDFHHDWCKKNGCSGALKRESCAIDVALGEFDALGLLGLLLRVDGRIAAFSFASALNKDVADVHVEKADTRFDGVYQMINQQMAERKLSPFKLVNREEDMGIEGLRKAKESYHPAILLSRFKTL